MDFAMLGIIIGYGLPGKMPMYYSNLFFDHITYTI